MSPRPRNASLVARPGGEPTRFDDELELGNLRSRELEAPSHSPFAPADSVARLIGAAVRQQVKSAVSLYRGEPVPGATSYIEMLRSASAWASELTDLDQGEIQRRLHRAIRELG